MAVPNEKASSNLCKMIQIQIHLGHVQSLLGFPLIHSIVSKDSVSRQ